MKFYENTGNIVAALVATLLWTSSATAEIRRPWSDWYQIQDEALNGIWFSWKCDAGQCEYRMDNRYTTQVKIRYSLRHIDSGGTQQKFSAEQRLATGVNESAEFALATREMKGVEVEIIEPKYTGPRSSKYVPSSTAEVDAEKKIQEAIKEAEARETFEREQASREAARQRREEREEQAAERQRSSDEAFQQTLRNGIQSLGQTFNNGMQQLADTDRQISNAQTEQRRQQEEKRQRTQRQLEYDRKERERVAIARADADRERRAETARREEERKENVRREEERKEQAEQERKRREAETCHDRTYQVRASSKRTSDNCVGKDTTLLVFLTNNSSEKVSCVVKFYNNSAPTGDTPGTTIKPGGTVGGSWGGIWACNADSYKYKCALPDDNAKCTDF